MSAISSLGGAGWQFFDNNGVPLSGGKLHVYEAGTTTLAVTYTSRSASTPNSNPIILDSAGRVSEEIWVDPGVFYKFTLSDANSVVLWTKDNIPGIIAEDTLSADIISYNPPFTGAVTSNYTVADKLAQYVSVKDFGAVGDGITDDTVAIQTAIDALQNANGGRLMFPNGEYYITSTLNIGDATPLSPNNTLAPVMLEGMGPVSGVGYASPSNCAIIKSNVAGPAIQFNATLGWGLKNFAFIFTTNSTSAIAAQFNDVESGEADGLVVLNCPGLTHLVFYSWGTKNVTLNNFSNIFVYMDTSPAGAIALHLNADNAGSNDVANNNFTNVHVQPGLADHIGVYLGYCDTNIFVNYSFNPLVGFLPAKALVFDYTQDPNNFFPNFNLFFGGSPYASSVESIGTPAIAPPTANIWYGFELTNNAPVPTALGFAIDRIILSADTTFYVNPNPSAGSGSFGPGDSTSFGIFIGRPCLTVQQAYDQIVNFFDLNGFNAIISVANGTNTAGINALEPAVGGRVIVQGQGGSTVFNTTGTAFYAWPGADIELQDLNVTSTASACVNAIGGTIRIGDGVVFGSASDGHIVADNNGLVLLSGDYFINGGASAHLQAQNGGLIQGSVTCTLLGNVTIADFAKANISSIVNVAGSTYSLGAYTVTGSRYSAILNGVINTNGGGATFFPGTIAGSTATGGQYA